MVSTVDTKPVTLAPLVPGNCAKRLPKNWVRDDVRGETMHTKESLFDTGPPLTACPLGSKTGSSQVPYLLVRALQCLESRGFLGRAIASGANVGKLARSGQQKHKYFHQLLTRDYSKVLDLKSQ